MQLLPLAAAFALALAPAAATAGEAHHTVVSAEQVAFTPGPATLPAGAQVAVLYGSPAKEGPFVIRLKFPAGFEIAPHRHSKEEHLTVISGQFGMTTGEIHQRSDDHVLTAGSFLRIPAGMAHFAWAETETVVQINGTGPFDVVYVDPADDPRIN